jgi:diacylglycerol kinase family enzyme
MDADAAPRLTETGNPPRAAFRRAEAVVNEASGSVGAGAADELRAIVADFGLELNVHAVLPDAIEQAVRAAVAAKPDLVIVLAGDGTARLAAALCGPTGPVVAPLPGGTMNMLPKAIYGDRTWQEALRCALNGGVTRMVSGGEVSGRTFYVAAILGAPALWAEAREAVREGHFLAAIRRSWRAARRAFSGGLRYSLDDAPRARAEALTLMCPLISKAMDEETALEAAALDLDSAVDAFRLAFNAISGDWRRDPSVRVQPCHHGRAYARGSMPVILDGEPLRLTSPVDIRFIPEAFQALEPARDVGEPRV